MNGLWTEPGIPHKGWRLIDVIDLRPDDAPVEETEYETCEMCGNERIRFVHIMEHNEHETLRVGCVCAEKMSGDYIGPRAREKQVRNRATRRQKWLSRKWRASYNGNSFLNVEGFNFVVFPNKYKPDKWNYSIDNNFGKQSYNSEVEAKLAMFDEHWPV